MDKEKAQPDSPRFSFQEPSMPMLLEHLSLGDKTVSNSGTEHEDIRMRELLVDKTKRIEKGHTLKRSYKRKPVAEPKPNFKKRIDQLQQTISSLESEVDRLRRRMDCCSQCRYHTHRDEELIASCLRPNYEEEMKKIAGNLNDSRGSMGSVQFENVQFHAPLAMSKELDDKAWVYMGTLMIAIGSKNLEVDGTINIFRVLKQSVDSLRRQVEKSRPDISLDFYLTQQEMKETDFMQDLGFDPFNQKISGETGLCLEGVKLESVEQFQLIYDSKLTYNIKYEALLGAVEYLRENSWVTF